MSLRARIALGVGLAAACSPPPELIDVADGTVVALVELDPDGAVVAGTRLIGPGDGPAWIPRPPARVVQYVWPADAAGVRLGLGRAEGVRAASGCEPRLPPPIEVRAVQGEVAAIPPPELTADWLFDRCPEISAETLLVEATCGALVRCQKEVVGRGACAFGLTGGVCDEPMQVSLTIDYAGRACLSTPLGCRPEPELGRERIGAAECSFEVQTEVVSCRVDVSVLPEPAPLRIDGRVPLHDVTPPVPGFTLGFSLLSSGDLATTLAPELALTSRFAVVATFEPIATLDVRRRCTRDQTQHPVALRTYELDSLEPGPVWPAPPCAAWLERTPEGEGVFVAHPDPDAGGWRITRLSGDGMTVTSTVVDVAHHPLASSELREIELGEGFVGALFEAEGNSSVVFLDPNTLRRARPDLDVIGEARQLGVGGPTVTIAVDQPGDRYLVVRSGPGGDREAPFFPRLGDPVTLIDAAFDPGSGTTLVAAALDLPGVISWRGSEIPELSERDGVAPYQPTRVMPWPGHSGLALVSAYANPERQWRGSLRRFSFAERRFLPGTIDLGEGAPTRIRFDDEGRVWILMGWSGQLLRLRPN